MSVPLSQLRRLVRARLGVPMVDDFFTQDVIDDAINLAISTIEAEQRWPWAEHVDTVQVSPDQPDILLEDRWRATRAVFQDTTELGNVAPSDYLTWSGFPASSGPQIWTVMGNAVKVAPQPADTIDLIHYWYSQPVTLYRDNDKPDMPGEFVGSIIAKAAELLSTREADQTAAATHLADYAQWLSRMRRDLRRSTGPIRIRVRPGSWI